MLNSTGDVVKPVSISRQSFGGVTALDVFVPKKNSNKEKWKSTTKNLFPHSFLNLKRNVFRIYELFFIRMVSNAKNKCL